MLQFEIAMFVTSLAILAGAAAMSVYACRQPVVREMCVQTDYTRHRHWQTPRFGALRDVEHGAFLVEEGRISAFPCASRTVMAWGPSGAQVRTADPGPTRCCFL